MGCRAAAVPTENGEPVVGPHLQGGGELGGFSPADLRSAYNLPSEGGAGQTVAITIAYDNPNAETDLAAYREHYGLAPCTTANGCFKKINQYGEAKNYPEPNSSWATESSLDLDMVSAICPKCHILLVETKDNFRETLVPAVERAANEGANVVSNSWGGEENSTESEDDKYLSNPGIPVLFSSGDSGYEMEYPAASPEVVAVGGTALQKDASARGWSEAVWSGAGSGCSVYQKKPVWQSDAGCSNRSVADVAAVADPQTPVSVYDTYERGGWLLLGGTSVAAPILAGVEALSTANFRADGPEAFWNVADGGELFDVTEGINGFRGTYLCQGVVGYDGPTGWGTPNGPLNLSKAITQTATVISSSEATFTGRVNPEGVETSYHFEYGTTTAYGTSVPVPAKGLGKGSAGVLVSDTIKGLAPRTTYHYRIVATDSTAGNTYGADRTFGTTAPTATTEAPTDLHPNRALMQAKVNPEGADTHYQFEYGTTTSYGRVAPIVAEGIGSGLKNISVSQQLGGLSGQTSFHYRIRCQQYRWRDLWSGPLLHNACFRMAAQTTPNGWPEGILENVSCSSGTDCMAVGSEFNAQIERWDGKNWTNLPFDKPNKGTEAWDIGGFTGVSCVSPTWCITIGRGERYSFGTVPLVEQWNGTKWTRSRLQPKWVKAKLSWRTLTAVPVRTALRSAFITISLRPLSTRSLCAGMEKNGRK